MPFWRSLLLNMRKLIKKVLIIIGGSVIYLISSEILRLCPFMNIFLVQFFSYLIGGFFVGWCIKSKGWFYGLLLFLMNYILATIICIIHFLPYLLRAPEYKLLYFLPFFHLFYSYKIYPPDLFFIVILHYISYTGAPLGGYMGNLIAKRGGILFFKKN